MNFGLLAQGLSRARRTQRDVMREDEQMARQQEQDARAREMAEIQQAALLAGLEEQGISQGGEGIPIGQTRFRQDPSRTRQAQQIAAERARQERLNQRRAVLKARGLNPDEIDVENDDIYESYAKYQAPKGPEAPVRGTPAYLKMLGEEERVRNEANPPQSKPVDVPNLSMQMNERFRQHPSVKAAEEMQGQVAMLNELRDGTPMGAGDIAIIIGFNKVLDPGAIVREGDVALAQSAASLKGRLETFVANAKEGEKMDPKLRADMLTVASRMASVRTGKARAIAQEFRALAQKHGGDPDLTTMGYQSLMEQQDDFTDAELSAAWNAGKRTDAEIAAWIKANRAPRLPR